MPDTTVSRDWLNFKDEDYSGSVCLLLPHGQATLIDADLFEWAMSSDWQVMGRTVFCVEYWPVSYLEMPGRRGKKQRRRIPSKTRFYSLHRLVLSRALRAENAPLRESDFAKRQVDHVSRNPWDNRRHNLRMATPSQNGFNKLKACGKSSRFKGVCRSGKGRWVANATLNGKTYYLGSFTDETSAAIAYNRFVAEHCGEFGVLNPITASPMDEPLKINRRRGRPRKPPGPRRKKEPAPILGEDGKPLTGFEWFKYLLRLEAQKREQSASQSPS